MATRKRNRKPASVVMPLRVFPVDPSGKPTVSDDFGMPRSGGRSHAGNDIFAPSGTPVLAADDGKLTHGTAKLGGTVAWVRAKDGTLYYYAHLSGYEGPERDVTAGEVIGYVGNTGNAAHTAPHLHFEVSPDGSGRNTVNPFPLLQDVAITAKPSGLPAKPAARSGPFRIQGLGLLVLVGAAVIFLGNDARSGKRRRTRQKTKR